MLNKGLIISFTSVICLLVVGVSFTNGYNKVSVSKRHITSMASPMQFFTGGFPFFETDKESNRKFRRTIFTKTDWMNHRSSSRYFRELKKMPQSIVLRGLASQAFAVGLFATVIVIYNILIETKILSHFPLLSLPSLPFSLTSSALSLLLVFRTNAAYSRWKDARIAWGMVSARSYDLIRQTVSWIKRDDLRMSIVQYTSAYSRCLKWELTHKGSEINLIDELSGILEKSEIDKILTSRYRSQWVLTKITDLLGLSDIPPNVMTHMDRGMCEISSASSTCDRIYSTPIPLVYTRHTARFLLIWLLTVPVALYHEFSFNQKWMVPIIAFLNSIFLFGIEELGVQIEEPFSILPLSNICLDIQRVGEEALNQVNLSWRQKTSIPQKRDFAVDGRNITGFGTVKSDVETIGDFNSTAQHQ